MKKKDEAHKHRPKLAAAAVTNSQWLLIKRSRKRPTSHMNFSPFSQHANEISRVALGGNWCRVASENRGKLMCVRRNSSVEMKTIFEFPIFIQLQVGWLIWKISRTNRRKSFYWLRARPRLACWQSNRVGEIGFRIATARHLLRK